VDPVGRHAALFNQGVRTGDFSTWLSTFAEDAVMTFAGLPIAPARGREAIADVYAAHPPSSPMRVVSSSVNGEVTTGRFVWVAAPGAGGEFVLRLRKGYFSGVDVTLDAPPPPPLPARAG
jgi:hypothetical protein